MRISIRTAVGAELQTAAHFGTRYERRPFTTLNELHGFQTGVEASELEYSKVQYLVAGIGGHQLTAGTSGIPRNKPISHSPLDTGLYIPVPWVMRLQTEDLTPTERLKYAGRISVEHEGENYFQYWLRRIDLTDSKTTLETTSIRDGNETTVPLVYNSSNLRPTPKNISSDTAMPTLEEADVVSTTLNVVVALSEIDVAEYVNAATIIYGSSEYAIISEVGLVAGIDKVVTAQGPGGVPFQFNEVIGAQIVSFMSDYNEFTSSNDTLTLVFDAGTVEPLLTELTNGSPNVLVSA